MNEITVAGSAEDTLQIDGPGAEDSTVSHYNSAPVSSDQRKSYRYPAQPGRDVATVRAGRQTWKAKLCEESAGGMAIETTGKAKLSVQDEVEIGIYTGWYRARVIHTQEISGGHLVGLQRISNISTDDGPRRNRDDKPPGQIRNMIAIAFVAMAAGVAATHYYGVYFGKVEVSGPRGIPTHYADEPNENLKGVLDGVNLLLEPHVAERLKLSDGQQESIQGVLIGASNSLSQAYEDSRNQPPDVWYGESQAIVNGALENILCGLTDEQVLKWRALMVHRRVSRAG